VDEILKITDGRGADVAIEALGTQGTFEAALRVLRPGGTFSSLGVYSSGLRIPLDAFAAGLGEHMIVTQTLCPGGKERMRRLMAVHCVYPGRPDAPCPPPPSSTISRKPTIFFSHQRDGVLKVAITP